MNATKRISPGELSVGMYVTVLGWKEKEMVSKSAFVGVSKTMYEESSWVGNVLKIEAINLPFIVTNELEMIESRPTIDTRKATLMELDLDFVKAKGFELSNVKEQPPALTRGETENNNL